MWKLKCHEIKVAEEYCWAIPQVRCGHTAADQVPVSLGFNWTPFHIHIYFTKWVLKYNLCKIWLVPDLAQHNYCISLRVTLCVHSCIGLGVCVWQLINAVKLSFIITDIRRILSCGTFRIDKLLLWKVNARNIFHFMLHFIFSLNLLFLWINPPLGTICTA
jgi:hypothetical protein